MNNRNGLEIAKSAYLILSKSGLNVDKGTVISVKSSINCPLLITFV